MTGTGMPLVSMVVPLYNHEMFVLECIESVIEQDYQNIELIVIDDGSRDRSCAVVERLRGRCDSRFVRFEFRSRENRGLSATVNEGLEWANGVYFATLASDDVLLKKKTSHLVEHLEREPSIAAVFGGCDWIDERGKYLGTSRPPACTLNFHDVLCGEHAIIAPSQLIRLDSLRQVGGCPPGLYIEDWYIWLKLTERGQRLAVVGETLVKYRQHETNVSKDAEKMYLGRREVLRHFSGAPGVAIAQAKASLRAAVDLTWVSKAASARYLLLSVRSHPPIALTSRFAYGCVRLAVPRSLARVLSHRRRPRSSDRDSG